MGIKELAAQVAAQHSDIPEAKITALLHTAFGALHTELAADSTEGPVKCAPLGVFRIVEKADKNGEKVRRIVLRLNAGKNAKGGPKGAKDDDASAE